MRLRPFGQELRRSYPRHFRLTDLDHVKTVLTNNALTPRK